MRYTFTRATLNNELFVCLCVPGHIHGQRAEPDLMVARRRPALSSLGSLRSLSSLRSARHARPAHGRPPGCPHVPHPTKTDALLLCVYSILYDYYVVCYIFGATTTHPGPPGRGASAPLRSHMVLIMFALWQFYFLLIIIIVIGYVVRTRPSRLALHIIHLFVAF